MPTIGNYFSTTFGIEKAWMNDAGVFDPTLDVDAPLFIDPFLLPYSKHQEFSQCATDKYDAHIGQIYKLVKEAIDGHEKAWRSALLLFQKGEVRGLQGTCLGYSKRSVRGRGLGPRLAQKSLVWAREVIELGVKDPEFFSSLPLFEDGIGADRISDMVANVIIECILNFNERMYREIEEKYGKKIEKSIMQIGQYQSALPQNPFENQPCPVILLPNDILKHLPLLDDPTELAGFAESNKDIRDRVNAHFSEIFKIRYKKEKEYIKRDAMKSAEKFQALLDLLKLSERKPYDIIRDPEGLLIWSHIAETTTELYRIELEEDESLPDIERINNVVLDIISQFSNLVEKNRLNQVFYSSGEPRHERFAQLLFFAIAKSYCTANNLDISPESDGGVGPVDFKLSRGLAKVIVEIKLSTNSAVVASYKKQVDAYSDAEGASIAHYVVIDVGKMGQKWDRLEAQHKANPQKEKSRFIHLVDGKMKESASKR